jgi:outer membrane protein
MKKTVSLMIAGCLCVGGLVKLAHGADLMAVYRDALAYDAQFAAARAALEAGREKLPQGRAGLLPTIGVAGSTTWNEQDSTFRAIGATRNSNFNTNGWTATLTQPLFRWQNWVAYTQSELVVAQAEAQFGLARQDMIVRAAQAYFDVLLAQDTLAVAQAQKVAIAEQLESAKRNFEVGTATITDTHEAQARYDLTSAQEIAALNDLIVRRQVLRAVIGKELEDLKNLRPGVPLVRPQPDDIGKWVEMAESASASVQIYQALYESPRVKSKGSAPGITRLWTWWRRADAVRLPRSRLPRPTSASGEEVAIPIRLPSASNCRFRSLPVARWLPAIARLSP